MPGPYWDVRTCSWQGGAPRLERHMRPSLAYRLCLAAEGRFDRMVALRSGNVIDIPLGEAIAVPKRVDVYGDAVLTARNTGISFGDE